jgi:hypothetical protein
VGAATGKLGGKRRSSAGVAASTDHGFDGSRFRRIAVSMALRWIAAWTAVRWIALLMDRAFDGWCLRLGSFFLPC